MSIDGSPSDNTTDNNAADNIVCWRCGKKLENLLFPFSRQETCANCNADQHVCKLCTHYKEGISQACTEERAEYESEKERANFCDYFQPKSNAYAGGYTNKESEAKQQLDALFNSGDTEIKGTDSEGNKTNNEQQSREGIKQTDVNKAAQDELNKLFGDD